VVIDAMTQAYSMEYANVHRGLHYLSNLATEKYEARARHRAAVPERAPRG
jgi:selenocysteine lyase/cysteine desulfurase